MVVYFKDWAEIESHYDERFDITGLTDAEKELKDAVASGESCALDKTYPTEIADYLPPKPEDWSNPDPTRHIRADVLRFVLLQKVKHGEMTEAGTLIFGAQITGMLDLNYATIPTFCGLQACRFERAIIAGRSNFKSQAIFDHNVLSSFSAIDATITGQLSFEGARFETTNGKALVLQGAEIGGALFLCKLSTGGTIDIKGAKIASQLNCMGVRFEAKNGKALDLQGAQIGDAFIFRKVQVIRGRIDLSATKASFFVDDTASWTLVDDLILDGFRYESITGGTKPAFAERMDWIEKGSVWNGEFFPQPYTQLAETYKQAGHDREARDVRIALAKKLNEHIRKDLVVVPNGDISVGFKSATRDIWIAILWLWHKLQLLLTGHGFKPQRALYALVLLVVACWGITHKAWHAGDFAPNSDVILLSEDWGKFKSAPNHAKAWEESQAGKDWESFSPIAYAADIVIPIVDFGQTQAWAPSTNRGPWGKRLWWMRWVFTAAGWIISALGAAAITGVIRRD